MIMVNDLIFAGDYVLNKDNICYWKIEVISNSINVGEFLFQVRVYFNKDFFIVVDVFDSEDKAKRCMNMLANNLIYNY